MKKENIKYAVFDIESNNWIDFLLLGFFDGNEYKEFHSLDKFLQHISQPKYKHYIFFAHNGGKFDFLFILERIMQKFEFKLIERTGSIIAILIGDIYQGRFRKQFEFRDSYALLKDSLKNLTNDFDVEHKKKGDVSFNRTHKANEPRLRKYLEHDCLGLFEVLTKFFASEFVVHPQMTIASQALDTFRSLYCDLSDVVRFPIDEEEYFRENWYSGGRVEVYKGYGKGLHWYDVNSLYPSAMLEEMPEGEVYHTKTYQKDLIGFYKVWIETLPSFYISPLLIKRDKENLFVNGKGEYFLSSVTLDFLVKEFGIKFHVLEGFYFKKKERIFNEYVSTFYKLKNEHKGDAIGLISKYMLNSLYGKFGQMRWKETVEVYTPDSKNFVQFENDFGLILVLKKSHSRFILPYLAAFITDLARLKHYQYMQLCEDAMFYCDTDSLFTSKKMPTNVVGKEIGQLHYEGSYDGIFLAPKSYALRKAGKEIVKFKGFDSGQFSYSDFKNQIKKDAALSMSKEKVLSFRQCLNLEAMRKRNGKSRLEIVRERGQFLKVQMSRKQVRVEYDKRIILPSDKHLFDTEPLQWFPQ